MWGGLSCIGMLLLGIARKLLAAKQA
jgi:hypothetical protein